MTPETRQGYPRRRRITWGAFFVLLWSAALCPLPLGAHDIAVLKSADITAYNQAVDGLKTELPNSTTLTEYDMQGEVAQGRKLARRIRASGAHVVITVGLKAALVAKQEITAIPIVYCMVLDPDKYDLHAPNMSGISLHIPFERQFSIIQAVLPNLKHIGVLYDPEKMKGVIEDARRVAKGVGVDLVERQVSSEKDLPAALRSMAAKVDALWLIPDSTILTEESLRFVLATTLDRYIPVVGFSSEFVRNGALIGLSVHSEDIGRQAGILAKKILNGQSPAAARAVPPDRIRFALNLKTAKFLGLALLPEVINRADELY